MSFIARISEFTLASFFVEIAVRSLVGSLVLDDNNFILLFFNLWLCDTVWIFLFFFLRVLWSLDFFVKLKILMEVTFFVILQDWKPVEKIAKLSQSTSKITELMLDNAVDLIKCSL